MTDWDKRFMDLARHVAGWSKDPSTKVGAVIVNPDGRVVATGYNGFPRGIRDDERLLDREVKYELTVHAEANAILNAVADVAGCTLYSTLCTCNECAKLIIQAGIHRVVVPMPPTSTETASRWNMAWVRARGMYREAGVLVTVLDV